MPNLPTEYDHIIFGHCKSNESFDGHDGYSIRSSSTTNNKLLEYARDFRPYQVPLLEDGLAKFKKGPGSLIYNDINYSDYKAIITSNYKPEDSFGRPHCFISYFIFTKTKIKTLLQQAIFSLIEKEKRPIDFEPLKYVDEVNDKSPVNIPKLIIKNEVTTQKTFGHLQNLEEHLNAIFASIIQLNENNIIDRTILIPVKVKQGTFFPEMNDLYSLILLLLELLPESVLEKIGFATYETSFFEIKKKTSSYIFSGIPIELLNEEPDQNKVMTINEHSELIPFKNSQNYQGTQFIRKLLHGSPEDQQDIIKELHWYYETQQETNQNIKINKAFSYFNLDIKFSLKQKPNELYADLALLAKENSKIHSKIYQKHNIYIFNTLWQQKFTNAANDNLFKSIMIKYNIKDIITIVSSKLQGLKSRNHTNDLEDLIYKFMIYYFEFITKPNKVDNLQINKFISDEFATESITTCIIKNAKHFNRTPVANFFNLLNKKTLTSCLSNFLERDNSSFDEKYSIFESFLMTILRNIKPSINQDYLSIFTDFKKNGIAKYIAEIYFNETTEKKELIIAIIKKIRTNNAKYDSEISEKIKELTTESNYDTFINDLNEL
jgi:hypothetical protein